MAIPKKAPRQEVVTKNDQMPAYLQKINPGDTRGNEGVGTDDLTIPRIELCQSLSKCRKKSDPAYIPGIEEGMFYNNVTRAIYGKEIAVVPVAFVKEFLLWRDQKLGGGFGGAYSNMQDAEAALNTQDNPDEWEAVATNQQFVLVVSGNRLEEAVISMAKSKNRVSKDWNSLIRINGGPRFSRRYMLKGVEAQNQQGKDYFNFTVENFGYADEATYLSGEAAYRSIMSGTRQIDRTIDVEEAEM